MNKWIIYALAKKESGGGSPSGGGDTVPNPALRLIDWEGTVLKEYSRESALALTELPEPPSLSAYAGVDHELLLFQEWNWSLADIKEWIQNHSNMSLSVTAIYITPDRETHNYFESPRMEDDSKAIYIQKRGNTNTVNYELMDNYRLKRVNIPKGTTWYGSYFVRNCHLLEFIGLPNGATNLNTGLFSYCTSLKAVSIPNGITILNNGMFERTFFEEVALPDTITNLSNNTFYSCENLQKVNIPTGISTLNSTNFAGCYALQHLDIPENVTSIGTNVFLNCSSLIDVIIRGKPTLSNINSFNQTPSTQRLYVPRANLSWFETATNWSTLYSGFVTIEDNIEYLERLGYNVDAYKTGGAA